MLSFEDLCLIVDAAAACGCGLGGCGAVEAGAGPGAGGVSPRRCRHPRPSDPGIPPASGALWLADAGAPPVQPASPRWGQEQGMRTTYTALQGGEAGVSPQQLQKLLHGLGVCVDVEEAQEWLVAADVKGHGVLDYEQFRHLLLVTVLCTSPRFVRLQTRARMVSMLARVRVRVNAHPCARIHPVSPRAGLGQDHGGVRRRLGHAIHHPTAAARGHHQLRGSAATGGLTCKRGGRHYRRQCL